MSGELWNLLLGTPLYSDVGNGQTPTLSGGSWLAGLPLTYLQDRRLNRVARSTNATLAFTQLEIDLKIPRPVRVFSIPKHTLSVAGYVRMRGYTGAGGTGTLVYDTGWLPGNTKPINLVKSSENIGSADWTSTNTPVVTPSAAFTDDVALDLVADDDVALTESRFQAITFKRDGTKGFSFHVKRGTAPAASGSAIDIFDNTAAAIRGRFVVLFNADGSIASVTPSSGAVLTDTISKSNTAFRIRGTAAGIIAANTNRYRIFPVVTNVQVGDIYVGGVQADPESSPLEYVRTDGAVAGYDNTGMNTGFLHVAAAPQIARYWVIEIDDTTNAAGYVDLARLVLAGGLQSTINMSYGSRFGLETDTERGVTDGGAALYNERPRRRLLNGSFANLPEDEALSSFYQLQQREGLHGQMMVVFDPTDPYHVHRRSFLAVQRELSPLERAMHARDTIPFSFVEEL